MNHIQTKQIIRNIAKQEELNIPEVELIVDSQFSLLSEVMKMSDREKLSFPSIRLPFLGIFYSPDWKVEQFKKINKRDEFIRD